MVKSLMHCPKLRTKQNRLFTSCGVLVALLLIHHVSFAQDSSTNNKALKLDGRGSYVQLPQDIFIGLTQATVEVWAKWADFGAFSRVFEFGAGYQSISLFNHSTNSDLRYNIYPRYAKGNPKWMFTTYARGLLRTNEWMHFAALSGPGGMKLYANGRLIAEHTNTTTFADIEVSQTNLLGRGLARGPIDRDFRGEIDEVRVWDHRRTLTQIREHMFKRLRGHEEGLTHLWNFDDGTAKDAGPNGHHGRLFGKARIGDVDLDLAEAEILKSPPALVSSAPTSSNHVETLPIVVPALTSAPLSANSSNVAAWWIAGALCALVVLLAWLVLMLRRSGIGSAKFLPDIARRELSAGESTALGAASIQGAKELKERALTDLTDFAKQSLVQGLYSQRAALLEVHQKAQHELAELEARVVALRLPERIQVYENRIAELETQLQTRGEEIRELTHATLQVLRQKLEEEKQKKPERFN